MLKKILKTLAVFTLVFLWLLSGNHTRAAFNERTETNAQGSSLTTPFQATLAVPTGTANGDLIFTWIGSNSATVTTNAAWTLIGSYTAASDKYYLFARVASSEPASYVWTFSGTTKFKAVSTTYIASSDFAVSNVSTDITVSNTSYRTSNVTNRAASFSVPNINSPIVFFGGVFSTTSRTQLPPTSPSIFAEDYDVGSTSPDWWLEISSLIWPASGATGVIDSILSAASTTKHSFAVALKTPTNNSPTLTVSQPDSSADTVIAGQSYNITYDLSDSDSTATVDFYYDTDGSGTNGTAITGCQNQAEGTGATCSWNTTGMSAGNYYVYGIASDGVNSDVNDYSPGVITIQAVVISVTITSDGTISYGLIPENSAKSTLPGELSDMQTASNDGNVTENFNIKGQNSGNWTLSASSGNNQYVHKFCNDTDNNCTSPPTSYTPLTTSYQTLDTGIAVGNAVDFQLQITTPNPSSVFTEQQVNVTIQAVQQ
jgi:hypothetical protein